MQGVYDLDTGQFKLAVGWVYNKDTGSIWTKAMFSSKKDKRAEFFELIPRYAHMVEFMGQIVRFYFVETKDEKKLYISAPNAQNKVELKTLTSWRKTDLNSAAPITLT